MTRKPTLLYPYHPQTGKRLTGTLEYRAIQTVRDVTKADGVLFLGHEVRGEREANTEIARLEGRVVLVTDDGDICFDSAAVWSNVDAPAIDVAATAVAQACNYRSPNEANEALETLADSAQSVVNEWEGSNLAGAINCLAGELEDLGYSCSEGA